MATARSTSMPAARASGSLACSPSSTSTSCCAAAFGGETGPILRRTDGRRRGSRWSASSGGSNGAYVHDRRSGEQRRGGRDVRRRAVEPPRRRRPVRGDPRSRRSAPTSRCSADRRTTACLPTTSTAGLPLDIRANGGRVVADLSGGRLAAAVEGGVDVLKVSEEELERDGRLAARRIRRGGDGGIWWPSGAGNVDRHPRRRAGESARRRRGSCTSPRRSSRRSRRAAPATR